MIPKECKRLAEVDFPIAVVSKHSAREKSIRHGHPSTLHLWWARRPLGACRAMLLALMLPDPCDEHCPADFKPQARKLLAKLTGAVGPKDEDLHRALLRFIGDFANWDVSSHPVWLEVGRGLVKAAHPEETPLVVDPFAGGGSIPLEALRLGCDSFSSDLNPVACLIQKVMLEDIPRNGPELADELRRVAAKVKTTAEKNLADFYPPDPDGARPIAYLWARTVRCEAPNCGAELPIFKSPWLTKRASRRARYFREAPDGPCVALVIDSAPEGGPIRFRIANGYGSIESKSGYASLPTTKAPGNNSHVLCPCCGTILKGDRVMAQLIEQHAGADVIFDTAKARARGATLLAVLTIHPQSQRKVFRLPNEGDYRAVHRAAEVAAQMPLPDLANPLNPTRPSPNSRGITAPVRYGATTFADLFTVRQRQLPSPSWQRLSETSLTKSVRVLCRWFWHLDVASTNVRHTCNGLRASTR